MRGREHPLPIVISKREEIGMKKLVLALSLFATFAAGFLTAGWLLYLAHEHRESRRLPVAVILRREAARAEQRELPSGDYFIGARENRLMLTVRPDGGVGLNSAGHRSFMFKYRPTSGFHVPTVALAVFDGQRKFRSWTDVGLRARLALKVQWLGASHGALQGSTTGGAFAKIGNAWVGPGKLDPPIFTYFGFRYRYGVKIGEWVKDGEAKRRMKQGSR